jgi:hypothetical protein
MCSVAILVSPFAWLFHFAVSFNLRFSARSLATSIRRALICAQTLGTPHGDA